MLIRTRILHSGKTMHFVLTLLCALCITGSVSSQRPDSVLNATWIETDSKWVTEGKTIYTYDSIQHLKTSLSYRWDNLSSSWIYTTKTIHYFNLNGKDSLEINSDWYNPTKIWIERNKTWYSYDIHGNNTRIVSQFYDTELEDWVDSDKKDITYDENGNDTMDIRYSWAVQTGWTASYKTLFQYDENGNNILSVLYSWDQTDFNKWLLYSKVEQTFDLNGNMIRSIPYNWDNSAGEWLPPQYKYECAFDENGNMVSDSSSIWDPGAQNSGQWLGTVKNDYTYNDEGSLSTVLTFTGDGTGSWFVLYRSSYYYPGQHVTLVPGIPDQRITVYPNPSAESVTFSLQDSWVPAQVEIWDMQGRKLLDQVLPENRTLNVSSLSKGVYICRIKSDGIVYSCKIVKAGD